MNKPFKYIPASKLYSKITDGTHDSPKQQSFGKYLITSKHIKGRNIDFESAYLITEEDYKKINERSQVEQWDVIVSMIGEYCGFCFIERNDNIDYAVKNVGLYKTKSELEANWLYYYLTSPIGKSQLNLVKSGSSQPYLTLGGLRELPILQPKSTQDKIKITKVLSDLDSKIEVNNKINAELEGMAKLIYEYWFVQFDFPFDFAQGKPADDSSDPKDVKPYKSSGGKMVCNKELKREIPKGWEVKELKSVSSLINRRISPTYLEEGGVCVLNQKCVRDQKINYEFSRRHDHIARDPKLRTVQKLDILVNSTGVGTLGRVGIIKWLIEETVTVDSHVTIVRSDHRRVNPYFIGFSLLQKQSEIEGFALGSTGQIELSKSQLEVIKLIIPPKNVQHSFSKIYSDILEKTSVNDRQNIQLSSLRDWLLPMLMNGQVRVKN